MKTKLFVTLQIILATIFIATAQPGIIDSTFGTNGKVKTQVLFKDYANHIVIQTDGKIVIGGNAQNSGSTQSEGVLIRYNSDGTIDSSFGVDGIVAITLGNQKTICNSIALQADGKIVATGTDYNYDPYGAIFLVRYTSYGISDSAFGNNGILFIKHFDEDEYGLDIKLQQDGKILVAGDGTDDFTYDPPSIELIRFNSNGTIDSAFGLNGYVDNLAGSTSEIAINTEGKIFVAIQIEYGYNYSSGKLSLLNSDGTLDTTINFDDLLQYNSIGNFLFQPDGKIIVAKGSVDNTNYFFTTLIRFNPDLSLDTTFGDNGSFIIDSATVSSVLQPDGKIITAGITDYPQTYFLRRYNPNGKIDSTFEFSEESLNLLPSAIALQSNGRIITVVDTLVLFYIPQSFEVRRYLNNTFSCSSNFTLVADTITPHHYWALNNATGIPPLKYFWDWNDGTIDTIAYPSHTYAAAGFYNICLTVTDSTNCTTQYCSYSQVQKLSKENEIIYVDVVSNIPTAIENTSTPKIYPVFPNPAQDVIAVSLISQQHESGEIIIYDLLGRIVYRNAVELKDGYQQFKIPVSNLNAGVYQIIISSHSLQLNKAFVKQ